MIKLKQANKKFRWIKEAIKYLPLLLNALSYILFQKKAVTTESYIKSIRHIEE